MSINFEELEGFVVECTESNTLWFIKDITETFVEEWENPIQDIIEALTRREIKITLESLQPVDWYHPDPGNRPWLQRDEETEPIYVCTQIVLTEDQFWDTYSFTMPAKLHLGDIVQMRETEWCLQIISLPLPGNDMYTVKHCCKCDVQCDDKVVKESEELVAYGTLRSQCNLRWSRNILSKTCLLQERPQ